MSKITPIVGTTGPLVVAAVYDGLCTFEFLIAAEIFGLSRPEMGNRWYRFASASIEPGPMRAHGGLRFETDGGSRLLDAADLIIIPGWKGAGMIIRSPHRRIRWSDRMFCSGPARR
jgi:AraC family transcriptional regulator, transcriptional activator FtrA